MANFNIAHTFLKKNSRWNSCAGCGLATCFMAANGSCSCDWQNADFSAAQRLVSKSEGGYSNDTRDPGNYTGAKIGVGKLIGTNYGISAPVLVSYWKGKYGKEPTEFDMKSLPYSVALEIYKKGYWNAIKGDEIDDQKVASILYDAAVNQGSGKAKRYVMDTLSIPTYDVKKINSANPHKLFNQIGAKREADYKKLGGYALNSWLKRLEDLGYEVNKQKSKIGVMLVGIGILAGGIYLYKRA